MIKKIITTVIFGIIWSGGVNANFVYVGNFNNNTVSIFDATSNAVTGLVTDSGNTFNGIYYIAVTPNAQKAYVANNNNGTMSIIDVATQTVTGIVSGATFNDLYSLAITPDGTKMYAVATGNNKIGIIDVATDNNAGLFVDDTSFPILNPFFMAVTPDGSKAYVPDFNANNVKIIDVATNTVTGVLTHADFTNPYTIEISPDGTIYVGNYTGNKIVVFDATGTYVTTIALNASAPVTDLAITPDGTTLYATASTSNGTVYAINTNTFSITPITDPNFDSTFFIAITPDGKTLYTSNFNSNTVSIIDTSNNTVTGVVSDPGNTFQGPYPLAIIPIPIYPPSSLAGRQIKNIFLTQVDFANIITWQAPTQGNTPVSYNIYRDAELSQKIGTVVAGNNLQFIDYGVKCGTPYTYYIVSVDASGNVSEPVSITIPQPNV